MKANYLLGLLFMVYGCTNAVQSTDSVVNDKAEVTPDERTSVHAEALVMPKGGWLVCGGRWTAGEGAELGEGYADLLGEGYINAGISGEPLPGLLQRLPLLLERQPKGLILEIGDEDQMLKAPLPAFQKHLTSLEQYIRSAPELKLLVIISATTPSFQKAITAFAERMGAPILDLAALKQPLNPEAHQQLAIQIRERFE